MNATIENRVPAADPDGGLPDGVLIERTRAGDRTAYETLYRRHLDAARRVAYRYSNQQADRDDLVATAFADVLQAIQRGGGPTDAFRPYLLVCIRRLAGRAANREWNVPLEDFDVPDSGPSHDTAMVERYNEMAAVSAFRSLPERWQTVLWHVVVEKESPAQVGTILGMGPSAVSSLTFRAKEGLRQAFLAQHVDADDAECGMSAERLSAFARGSMRPGAAEKVREHVDHCSACCVRMLELTDVEATLCGWIAPALLALPLTAYLQPVGAAALHGGVMGWLAGSKLAVVGTGAAVVAGLGLGVYALAHHPAPAPTTASVEAVAVAATTSPAPAIAAVPLGQVPAVPGAPAESDAPVVRQGGTLVVEPGWSGSLRVALEAGDARGTLVVRLPEHTRVIPGLLAGNCRASDARSLTCTGVRGTVLLDVPVEVEPDAPESGEFEGGSAVLQDAEGRALAHTPLRVQARDCGCGS